MTLEGASGLVTLRTAQPAKRPFAPH